MVVVARMLKPEHSVLVTQTHGGVVPAQVMVTNFGIHSPRQWARTSAMQAWQTIAWLLAIGENVSDERKAQIERFRRTCAEAIEPFWRDPDPAEAPAALTALLQVAEKSEWEMSFKHPDIRAILLNQLTANLASAKQEPM